MQVKFAVTSCHRQLSEKIVLFGIRFELLAINLCWSGTGDNLQGLILLLLPAEYTEIEVAVAVFTVQKQK